MLIGSATWQRFVSEITQRCECTHAELSWVELSVRSLCHFEIKHFLHTHTMSTSLPHSLFDDSFYQLALSTFKLTSLHSWHTLSFALAEVTITFNFGRRLLHFYIYICIYIYVSHVVADASISLQRLPWQPQLAELLPFLSSICATGTTCNLDCCRPAARLYLRFEMLQSSRSATWSELLLLLPLPLAAGCSTMIASFDLYRLRGTTASRFPLASSWFLAWRRFHWSVPHRFVTSSGFVLHCAFHIS